MWISDPPPVQPSCLLCLTGVEWKLGSFEISFTNAKNILFRDCTLSG